MTGVRRKLRGLRLRRRLRGLRARLRVRTADDLVWDCRDACGDFGQGGGRIRVAWDMWGRVSLYCRHGRFSRDMWGFIPHGVVWALRGACYEFLAAEHPARPETEESE